MLFKYLVYWFTEAFGGLFVPASAKAPNDSNLTQWGQAHYGCPDVCSNLTPSPHLFAGLMLH